jgi:hypothetical protein
MVITCQLAQYRLFEETRNTVEQSAPQVNPELPGFDASSAETFSPPHTTGF